MGKKRSNKRRPPTKTRTAQNEEDDPAAPLPSNNTHSHQSSAGQSSQVPSITDDGTNENTATAPRGPQDAENQEGSGADDEDGHGTSNFDGREPPSDAEDRQESASRILRSQTRPTGQPSTATPTSHNTRPESQGSQSSGDRRAPNSAQRTSNAFQVRELATRAQGSSRLDLLRGPPPAALAHHTKTIFAYAVNATLGYSTTSMAPISQSTSTIPPGSRKRTPEHDEDSEVSKEEQRRAKKKKHNDARPRLRHFSDNAQLRDVLELAMTLMKIEIATVCPYPATDVRTRLVDECFERALQQRELPPGHFALDKAQQRMILGEEGNTRSAIKKAIKARVAVHYGLVSGPSPQQAINNKERAQFLLSESRFHFQDPDGQQGWFRNPFIADAVIASWFSHSNALGVLYQEFFNPIRLESLALILTIWAETGTCKEFDLPQSLWSTFDDFLLAIQNYENWSSASAMKLKQTHSGAKEDVPSRAPVIEVSNEAMEAEMQWQESQVNEDDSEDID
ncbi:hypothetical protein FRC01_004992 [Tulasnella sp. 417]|nr:hypothetical protein FRC01_004992 [Tulasnella sp. 417]